jgi:hypothetical protein
MGVPSRGVADDWHRVLMNLSVAAIRRALAAGSREKAVPTQLMSGARAPDGRITPYGVFLPKHRRGNPGGYTEYFEQHGDGSHSLIK